MKITKVETIWFDALPNAVWETEHPHSRQALPHNIWVRIHTDKGLVGLGETYYLPRAVSAIIHDVLAPLLIGRNALDVENHWNNMFSLVNFFGFAGSEMRAISAVDIALWDLAGQYSGQAIYNLLGGRNRETIPVYNTCVSYGKHRDYQAWMEGRAGELAQDLLNNGIKGMKIWPFDRFGTTLSGPAEARSRTPTCRPLQSAGVLAHHLSNEDLKRGLAVIEDIRLAVGDKVQIAIEGHARWDLPTAVRIGRALEPYDILWLEEIMPPDNPEAFVRLKAATTVPLCQSERVFTRFGFRPLVEQNVADIIMPDIAWCGGITEARKIASLADTYYLPITLHDCIGPVSLWASIHLLMHIPNALMMEIVRGYLDGWYNDVVKDPIAVENGYLTLGDKPGLGISLRDDFFSRPGAHVKSTGEQELHERQ